ncbi:LacI family DNA-binding transcriptional regulator [Paenarthrobacter sp. Z7-10]|uniref:LacI family DNA-binding transcriptional regulator n=1 Tax=Paenarthrobacter sp. Z7-10 TaxID=2787635 RepID=UPI0022A9C195|nr:LacI family DNA-binding transcriptional regulator [Paenarthrobacter sp. Z7-10]MCZ2401649.1 LacI family DNA-binding transcriptional regulator [Paenarthrobacter sp. Z7-10]
MVTSRDVAELAGVSQATVSRAISSSSKLSAATAAKVHAAMATLGYVPHAGAQAMKTRRTNTVGVVVADLTNPFYPEVLDELTRELDAAGYRAVIWNAGGGSHSDALKAIREHAVDGVIFTTATEDSLELQAAVQRQSPIVLINRMVDGLDCDQVTSSNLAGGAAVADFLVQNGKFRPAFIGGTPAASTSRDREAGFLLRMAEQGHPVPDRFRFPGNFSHDVGAEIMRGLLAGPGCPDAVFCANDYMAFGAIDALRAHRDAGGDGCWIVGYDDVEMASWQSFDLTTVRQPSREMARAGTRMLLQRIASPGLPARRLEFPCQLIVRGSCS